MSVNQIHELDDYVKYLESYSKEVSNLYRELLIGVTSFFRDAAAFREMQEKWLPKVLEHDSEIRFWISACSTGEEAYSLAILCKEWMRDNNANRNVKIFATDVDASAVLFAGAGVYPDSITADLSQSLITRYFFRKDENHFQISREIREMVVFANHNIINDPPFTNIKLISCRNLLIYLQPVLQNKVLQMFNFSLLPEGILFLGPSETIGGMADYFAPIDLKWKIYLSKGKSHKAGTIQEFASDFTQRLPGRLPLGRNKGQILKAIDEERLLDRIVQAFAAEYTACGLVVGEQMELLHILGNADDYLSFPPGRVQNDLSKIITKELSIPLLTGIQRVLKSGEKTQYSSIRLGYGDEAKILNIRLKPIEDKKHQESMVLVLIDDTITAERKSADRELTYDIGKEAQQRIQDLEQELQFSRENLQATIEELETSNEELQATNEELLASNEELQSTNEELQSVNEELYTVNAEYQHKIVELTDLTNDIDNLFASTQLITLFLDENLEVRRFTPDLTRIFRIIDGDVGRPLSHLSHNLLDVDLEALAKSVRDSRQTVEREVETEDGEWYLIKAIPYLTGPQTFEGVVITFFSVTGKKDSEQQIQFQADLLRCLDQAVIATDLTGKIIYWNDYAEALYQWKADEVLGKNIKAVTAPRTTAEQGEEKLSQLRKGGTWRGEFQVQKKDGTVFLAEVKDAPICNTDRKLVGIVDISKEVIHTKSSETLLKAKEEQYRLLIDNLSLGYAYHSIIKDNDGKPIDYVFLEVNEAFEKMTGLSRKEILKKKATEAIPGISEAESDWIEIYGQVAVSGETAQFEGEDNFLRKKLRITAYSPMQDHFVTVFEEVAG